MNVIVSIIGIVVFVAACIFGGCLIYLHNENSYGREKIPFKKGKLLLPILFGFLGIGIFLFGRSFVIVPTGSTGVISSFGLIHEEPLTKGFNWKRPFVDSVELVNNKQQDITVDGQVWSETAEQTAMYMENITITYAIDASRSTWIYANVTNYDKNLLTNDMVYSALKTASRKITTVDVTNRGIIEPAACEALQEVCDDKYGEDTVHIINVVVNNMDFEDSYNQAIAKRQEVIVNQEQQAIDNQTNIDKATAEAEAKRINAQGTADATITKANAKAEANRIISESITDRTQRQDAIDAWDGVPPKYISGNTDGSFGILDTIE